MTEYSPAQYRTLRPCPLEHVVVLKQMFQEWQNILRLNIWRSAPVP